MNSRVAVEIMGWESEGNKWVMYAGDTGYLHVCAYKADFTPTTDLRHTSQSWCKLTGEQKADASVIGAEQSGEHRYGKIFDHWLENPDKWCEAMLAAKGGG